MPTDYKIRNVVEAIKISDKGLTEKQNSDPLCTTIKRSYEKNLSNKLT
jgi:hypothetical protein